MHPISRAIAVWGDRDTGLDPSYAVLIRGTRRDRRLGTDFRLFFLRGQNRSVLSQTPTVFERAALFRPRFVGVWTYWVLLAVVLIGVPALVVRALWTAGPGPGDPD